MIYRLKTKQKTKRSYERQRGSRAVKLTSTGKWQAGKRPDVAERERDIVME